MTDAVVEQFRIGKDAGEHFLDYMAEAPISSITIIHRKHPILMDGGVLDKFEALDCPYKVKERNHYMLSLTLGGHAVPPSERLNIFIAEKCFSARNNFTGDGECAVTEFLSKPPMSTALKRIVYDRVYKNYKDLLFIDKKHAEEIIVKFTDWETKREVRLVQKYLLQKKIDSLDLY